MRARNEHWPRRGRKADAPRALTARELAHTEYHLMIGSLQKRMASPLIRLSGGSPCPPRMASAWRAGTACDLDVVVDGQTFSIHRIVAISASDYMDAALAEKERWLDSQGLFQIGGVTTAKSFEAVLDFM